MERWVQINSVPASPLLKGPTSVRAGSPASKCVKAAAAGTIVDHLPDEGR
jgi:hypothetical protein